MNVRYQALVMSGVRAGIGVASIASPAGSARVAGYPAGHDNPSARTTARLFGVRELLLAGLVVQAVRRPQGPSPTVFAVQAAVDAADVAVQAWPLIKREGIDRGTVGGIAVAAGAAVLWARLARQASQRVSAELP